jgi:hypothetical protein
MIRKITVDDKQAIITMMSVQKAIMSQDMNQELMSELEIYLSNFTQWANDLYSLGLCYEIDRKIQALILVRFNPDINAWKLDLILSNIKSRNGGIICLKLLNEVIEIAESRGFHQYFYLIETDKEDQYQKIFNSKIGREYLFCRYERAIDEHVPAKKRPTTGVYWDWLFSSKTKNIDTAVVHHFLPAEYRQFILGKE